MVQYKERCKLCKNEWALVNYRVRFPVCLKCQMKQLNQEVTDPEFKKMFDIDKDLYEQNSFLRDIKIKYIRFGQLSEKQIETFKRVAKEMKEAKSSPEHPQN